MSERDPRIDPLACDVVSKGKLRRTVFAVSSGKVFYRRSGNHKVRGCGLSTWRDWCRGATVVKPEPEAAEKESAT